jgi:hypothetical protein
MTAVRIQNIKTTLVKNRPDFQHGAHIGAAAHACVVHRKACGLRTDPERSIVRTDEFHVVAERPERDHFLECPYLLATPSPGRLTVENA